MWIAGGILLALAIVGVAAWEYTSSPTFCGSCHEISPSANGFADSPHAKDAECMDCHADEGLVGEFVAHVGGLQEAYVHFGQSPNAGDIHGTVPNDRCLACHEKDWAKLEDDHPTKDAPCGVCHRDSSHTIEKPLYIETKAGE
ncbi:MAG TPA: NapC/NirT family cytochrome c [Coriobacteriia bacterium]|nr:NapC/NirT family cytochrome c [Coriobacteriia bacterium]